MTTTPMLNDGFDRQRRRRIELAPRVATYANNPYATPDRPPNNGACDTTNCSTSLTIGDQQHQQQQCHRAGAAFDAAAELDDDRGVECQMHDAEVNQDRRHQAP